MLDFELDDFERNPARFNNRHNVKRRILRFLASLDDSG
jgi:hypothetical protein